MKDKVGLWFFPATVSYCAESLKFRYYEHANKTKSYKTFALVFLAQVWVDTSWAKCCLKDRKD